jgi:hypothetical protein
VRIIIVIFKIKAKLQHVFSLGQYCGANFLQGSLHLKPSNPATDSTRIEQRFSAYHKALRSFIALWCYISVRETDEDKGSDAL